MGNKNSTKGLLQIQKAFPYQLNYKDINYQVKLQDVQFQPSVYNIEQQKFVVKPFIDKEIRDSEFCNISIPELSNSSKPIIQNYFKKIEGFDKQFSLPNNIWRMTKYQQNGHFVAHCDREKLLSDHKHFGTEIFLPPKSQCNYQGGELVLRQDEKQVVILPHESKWTHLILPLGIQHRVDKISKGTRISYVKQIWVKQIEQPIQTDQDRQRREQQQNRRRFVHRQRHVLD